MYESFSVCFKVAKSGRFCSVLFLRLCFLVCVLTTNVKTPLLRWCCDIKIVPSSNSNSFLQLYHILYSMWIAQPMLSLGGWYSTPASFHLPARESQVNEPREWRWSEQWGKRRRKRTKIKDWGFRDSVFWFVWVWPINHSSSSTLSWTWNMTSDHCPGEIRCNGRHQTWLRILRSPQNLIFNAYVII